MAVPRDAYINSVSITFDGPGPDQARGKVSFHRRVADAPDGTPRYSDEETEEFTGGEIYRRLEQQALAQHKGDGGTGATRRTP